MKRVLFVCEGNRHRSPTAANLYASTVGIKTRSAGFSPLARTQMTEELLAWADTVFVMERRLAKMLLRNFPGAMAKEIVTLDIPDEYQFMEPELITELLMRLEPYLGKPESAIH